MEFHNNKDKNSEFLVSDDIDKEIKKYLDEKVYSSEIGDIIVNIHTCKQHLNRSTYIQKE